MSSDATRGPQQPPQAPPEEQARNLPFYQAALNEFRATAANVFASHPEVRSAVVVLDYRGGLNDAKIDKAIWLGDNGPVNEPAAMFGGIYNMLGVLEVMFTRAAQNEQAMVQRAQALGAEIVKREQRLAEVNKAVAAAEASAPGPIGPTGPTGGPRGEPEPERPWPDRIWYNGGRREVTDSKEAHGFGDVYGQDVGEHQLASLGYVREGSPGEIDGWWYRQPRLPAKPQQQEREADGRFTGDFDPGAPPARHRRLLDHEVRPPAGGVDDLLADVGGGDAPGPAGKAGD